MHYVELYVFDIGIATIKDTQSNIRNPIKLSISLLHTVVGGGYSNGADVPGQYMRCILYHVNCYTQQDIIQRAHNH